MTFNTHAFFAVALASFWPSSLAQETCSADMTKFVDTPTGFDSIVINPTCTSAGFFTTTKLAWTIEPLEEEDAEPAIYSYPPNAVTVALDENVLVFDLNDMAQVPDKAGVVIQVPKWQLRDVTVDGVENHVKVAAGFPNLLKIHSLGTGSYVEANMTESLYSKLIVDASNSVHSITGEYLNFQMNAVSSKVYITGSILGGEYDGFSNEVYVTGRARDLSVVGNKNMLATSDCASVVVDSFSSSCTILEEGEVAFDFESIPCTYPASMQKCVSTNYGYCHCTDQGDSTATPSDGDKQQVDETTSASSTITGSIAVVAAVVLAVVAATF